LLSAGQNDLRKAYKKAVSKKYMRKAEALKMFVIPEGTNEQRKPTTKKRGRYSNRKRINRTIGNQKERIKRVAV